MGKIWGCLAGEARQTPPIYFLATAIPREPIILQKEQSPGVKILLRLDGHYAFKPSAFWEGGKSIVIKTVNISA